MSKVNIQDMKTHLSRLVDRVVAGEVITVCRRNVPVAELRPLPRARTGPRPLGIAKQLYGDWQLPESFFDPLPDDLLDAFGGEGG